MKTTRLLLLSAALAGLAACGTRGDLVMPETAVAKAGASLPTGGTSAPMRDGEGDNAGNAVPNADGELPDETPDDTAGDE